MEVWLNGAFVDDTEAAIGVFDASIQHAVGLFETMAARNGRVFRLEQHIDRLIESAVALSLTERLQSGPLAHAVTSSLERSGMKDARIRLTVTGGDLNPMRSGGSGGANDPTVLVVPQPPTPYPEAFFSGGVDVILAPGRLNPWSAFAGHKTVNYWERIRGLQHASLVGAGEALWADPAARVQAGSVSNLFVVRDGVLWTPPARGQQDQGEEIAPVLPGITRQAVLELTASAGIRVDYHAPTIDELFEADEVFLTNSSWQVLPVTGMLMRVRETDEQDVQLHHKPIADGSVGAMTADLRSSLLAMIERETTGQNV